MSGSSVTPEVISIVQRSDRDTDSALVDRTVDSGMDIKHAPKDKSLMGHYYRGYRRNRGKGK